MIEFPALWQLTDKEQAELRRIEAETDRIYLQEGVLLPEEVALKRFNKSDFAIDLKDSNKNDARESVDIIKIKILAYKEDKRQISLLPMYKLPKKLLLGQDFWGIGTKKQ